MCGKFFFPFAKPLMIPTPLFCSHSCRLVPRPARRKVPFYPQPRETSAMLCLFVLVFYPACFLFVLSRFHSALLFAHLFSSDCGFLFSSFFGECVVSAIGLSCVSEFFRFFRTSIPGVSGGFLTPSPRPLWPVCRVCSTVLFVFLTLRWSRSTCHRVCLVTILLPPLLTFLPPPSRHSPMVPQPTMLFFGPLVRSSSPSPRFPVPLPSGYINPASLQDFLSCSAVRNRVLIGHLNNFSGSPHFFHSPGSVLVPSRDESAPVLYFFFSVCLLPGFLRSWPAPTRPCLFSALPPPPCVG